MELEIIVVDNSELSRRATINLLEQQDVSIVGEAADSQRALELINLYPCNVCFIDLMLPSVSGIELIEAIRENNETVLIVLTSYLAIESLKIEAILDGASDVLEKPLDQRAIAHLVPHLKKLLTVRS